MTAAVPNADVAVTHAPAALTVGVPFSASFLVRNTGTAVLDPAQHFRLGSQGPQDTGRWGTARVELPEMILPGATKEFTVDNFVPQEAGTFQFAWLTLQEGVRWFGRILQSIQVTVAAAPGSGSGSGSGGTQGLVTAPANVSAWKGPYPAGGGSSVLILNTGPFAATPGAKQAVLTNDTQRTVRVLKVDDWLGADLNSQMDTQIYAVRNSDGSFLFLSPRDHYANGPEGNFRQHALPGDGFVLAPGDGLTFVWFANAFAAGPRAHYQVVLHYEG